MWLATASGFRLPVPVSFLSIMLCWLKIKSLLMGLGLASWCGAKHYNTIEWGTKYWKIICKAVIRGHDEKWNGIREANFKTDGLASDAVHVRYAIILSMWSKLFCVCLSWSMCTLSVQQRFTDEVHFLKEIEWRYNKKTSCRLQQDALGSAKDNGRPINGLPILLHLFH